MQKKLNITKIINQNIIKGTNSIVYNVFCSYPLNNIQDRITPPLKISFCAENIPEIEEAIAIIKAREKQS